jgi:50S ribosomal protein L16 3-hydroxylase
MSMQRFADRVSTAGLRLDPRTRMLFRGAAFFINGERMVAPSAQRRALVELANRRALPPQRPPEALLVMLYEWYKAGFLWPGSLLPST